MIHRHFLRFDDAGSSRAYSLIRTNLLHLALTAFRQTGRRIASKALIIPPCAEPGSLGDHAMMSVAVRELRNAGCQTVDIASTVEWPLVPGPDGMVTMRSDAGFRHRLKVIQDLAEYDYVCLIGADVIDGAYGADVIDRLALLGLAAKLGCRTSVLGASFRGCPDPRAVEALRALPPSVVIKARDPLSQARMEQRIGRPIMLCGDLAALLPEDRDHPDAMTAARWIAARRKDGRPIVGVNFNGMETGSNPQALAAFQVVAKALCSAGCALVLIPHDRREVVSDIRTLVDLQQKLHPDDEPSYLLPTDSVAATKAILGQLDFLVAGRMHASILAMSSGTPAIGFPYNGKFEGLYAMMGMADEGLLVDLADLAADPLGATRWIMDTMARSAKLRSKLTRAIPEYMAAAMRNFADLPDWRGSAVP